MIVDPIVPDLPFPSIDLSAQNGFAGNRIDRQSEARPADAVAAALADQNARIYLLVTDRALVAFNGAAPLGHHAIADAQAVSADLERAVLLGFDADTPILAAPAPETALDHAETLKGIDLRSLAVQGLLPADQLGAIAQARSMLGWHDTHGFCARCGARSVMAAGGVRRECPSCGAQHFPRVDPVAIMLAVDGDRCLLGRQTRFVEGMYSCLAGFIEPGETIEDAVRRETFEESGIRLGAVRYHSSQPWPFVSSLMIGCLAEAQSTEITMDAEELEDCRWFSRDEVIAMLERRHPDGLGTPPPMAIAHALISAFVRG